MAHAIADITIPDSTVARDPADLIRSTVGELLFNHSSRVFLFGALKGRRRGLTPDLGQLYVAALFHDLGLASQYAGSQERFEMDGADVAREFLLAQDRSAEEAHTAWLAIALHTTPSIPRALAPETALVAAGVETDVLGLQLDEIGPAHREAVVDACPRPQFKRNIPTAFNDGMKHRFGSTFGTMTDDVLAHFDASFERANFAEIINSSAWAA
ncbi:MAG: HD domain-containing protein [Janthinobacterium lividum]